MRLAVALLLCLVAVSEAEHREKRQAHLVPEEHPNRPLLPDDNACGITIHDRIVGGNVADIGEYPWLALILLEVVKTGTIWAHCGGSLINSRYVLTAAHCVVGLSSNFTLKGVRLGEYDLTSNPDCQQQEGRQICANPVQDFEIEEVIDHSDYDPPTLMNDIALVRLDRSVTNSPYISPICMPFGEWRTRDYSNSKLWVAGFGATDTDTGMSDILMELKVPVVSNQQCAPVILRQLGYVIGPNQMCAGGEEGRDSCSGDSGGPLMALNRFGPPYRIIGVVSFGEKNPCGTKNVPGVYTRVGQYLNWIMDNIRA